MPLYQAAEGAPCSTRNFSLLHEYASALCPGPTAFALDSKNVAAAVGSQPWWQEGHNLFKEQFPDTVFDKVVRSSNAG